MENEDIILIILVFLLFYLLYRDICIRREKFASKKLHKDKPIEIKNIDKCKNGSCTITDAIKNLGLIAQQLQHNGSLTIPGDIVVKGKITGENGVEISSGELLVHDNIKIPDVIDFGKKRDDDGRKRIQFGNPENQGNTLDIAMNNNHIRDVDILYLKYLSGNIIDKAGGRSIKIGAKSTLDLDSNDIVNFKEIIGELYDPNFKSKITTNHLHATMESATNLITTNTIKANGPSSYNLNFHPAYLRYLVNNEEKIIFTKQNKSSGGKSIYNIIARPIAGVMLDLIM